MPRRVNWEVSDVPGGGTHIQYRGEGGGAVSGAAGVWRDIENVRRLSAELNRYLVKRAYVGTG